MEKKRLKKEFLFERDIGKTDISLEKLIIYNLIFFVPIGVFVLISTLIAPMFTSFFNASAKVVFYIILFILITVFFFIIVPYIRHKENVRGVRLALVAFLIVGFSMLIPHLMIRNFGVLYNQLLYVASYIFATFIYCPEVLGMQVDLRDWFKHGRQLIILLIYVSIVLFYVMGFAWFYYQMDVENQKAFNYDLEVMPSYGTFVYYSLITFATVGYGEITPVSTASRFIAGLEAMVGLVINAIFIAVLFIYITNAQQVSYEREERKEEAKIEKEIKAIRKK